MPTPDYTITPGNTGGTLGDTNGSVGSVRVRIVYWGLLSLANAV